MRSTLEISFLREQLEVKERMLADTTAYLVRCQEALEEKNRKLENARREMTESIRLSALIQETFKPDLSLFRIFFQEASYLVRQQIGIGGDTIVAKNTGEGLLFGLFDCTGHGIPGSLLSVAASLIFQQLVESMGISDPQSLSQLLNAQMYRCFNTEKHSLGHMEGTLCLFSSRTGRLCYSSARGRIWLLQQEERGLLELPNGRNCIGSGLGEGFELQEVNYRKGDKLLLFSDGLTDQFGGSQGRKYSRKKLRAFVEKHLHLGCEALKTAICAELSDWQNDNEQTDDLSFLILQL